MKRTRFTDEQIISLLAEHAAAAKRADLCRKHGMSKLLDQTGYDAAMGLLTRAPKGSGERGATAIT